MPPFPDWRQQKVIFMNGGGGHEESVTWVLAEAERGMLVHCCCFVVNLVRGYTAARLLDALHQLGQVTWSPGLENYSTTSFTHSGPHIYPRPQRWACVFVCFFFFFSSFFSFTNMFWHSFLNVSTCHGGTRWRAQTGFIMMVSHGRHVTMSFFWSRFWKLMLTLWIVSVAWTRVVLE